MTALRGLRMKTGVYWSFDFQEEVQRRTFTRQVANHYFSINLVGVMAIIGMAAFVIKYLRGERSAGKREAVIM